MAVYTVCHQDMTTGRSGVAARVRVAGRGYDPVSPAHGAGSCHDCGAQLIGCDCPAADGAADLIERFLTRMVPGIGYGAPMLAADLDIAPDDVQRALELLCDRGLVAPSPAHHRGVRTCPGASSPAMGEPAGRCWRHRCAPRPRARLQDERVPHHG